MAATLACRFGVRQHDALGRRGRSRGELQQRRLRRRSTAPGAASAGPAGERRRCVSTRGAGSRVRADRAAARRRRSSRRPRRGWRRADDATGARRSATSPAWAGGHERHRHEPGGDDAEERANEVAALRARRARRDRPARDPRRASAPAMTQRLREQRRHRASSDDPAVVLDGDACRAVAARLRRARRQIVCFADHDCASWLGDQARTSATISRDGADVGQRVQAERRC